jgi:hypothetical protein
MKRSLGMNDLSSALNKSKGIRTGIYEMLHRQGYPSATKNILLVAYMDIAFEHNESIAVLIGKHLYGSAFALMRPLFDTLYRALWVNGCATEAQIEEIAENDRFKFPGVTEMVEAIDGWYASEGFFSAIKTEVWEALCSYTHSGLLQVSRRFVGHTVKPSYKDGELLEVINATTAAIILLARMFFVSMNCKKEADEAERMMFEFGS